MKPIILIGDAAEEMMSTPPAIPRPAPALDTLSRPLRDLRISVTDRCNFRCPYCMPRALFGPGFRFLPRGELLTFEEIARLARAFAHHGAEKVRLTGGEPLLRTDLPALVRMLAAIPGIRDIALTTNGSLLARHAAALHSAGLDRVTVSLDSLDDGVFRMMNDADFPVSVALDGLEAARRAGLGPIKVNAVVRRGVNEDGLVDLASYARDNGFIARFIEYMDVGTTNGWRLNEVVPAAEILSRISVRFPLEPIGSGYPGEVARRYRYLDGGGEIGLISSVTQPFCAACTRVRLSADGRMYTCLFATTGLDLRTVLRRGCSDTELLDVVASAWRQRSDRYSELRALGPDGTPAAESEPRIEMSYIGG